MKKAHSQFSLRRNLERLRVRKGQFNLDWRYYATSKLKKNYDQVNKVLKQFQDKVVLDVGCHIGYFSVLISSYASKVIGIDVDEEILEKAEYFKSLNNVSNADFKTFSVFDLDDDFMQDNKIDAVFFHNINKAKVSHKDEDKRWSVENKKQFYSLLYRHCDIVMLDDIGDFRNFFQKRKKKFIVEAYRFKVNNNPIYIAKRKIKP